MADPTPLDLTQPWWEQHQGQGFVLPRCASCQRFHFYPQAACPHCGHAICQAAPASGGGDRQPRGAEPEVFEAETRRLGLWSRLRPPSQGLRGSAP